MANPNHSDGPRTVDAVQTALDIINELQQLDSAGVTELADILDLSKGTVHSHLSTLRANEYVVKDDNEYRLSLRYLDLGEYVRQRLGGFEAVKEELDDLAEETGELAQFSTEEHGQAVYLYKATGTNAVQTRSRVGRRDYIHSLALGKAILAYLPEDRVHEIVDRHGLPEMTSNTITEREALFDELEAIREQGYAINRHEANRGVHSVGAPVVVEGSVLGAISIAGPANRLTIPYIESEVVDELLASTNEIELMLTHQSPG